MGGISYEKFTICFYLRVVGLPVALHGACGRRKEERPVSEFIPSCYRWSDSILEGVRSVLDESEFKIDLQIEYMDAKKFNYEDVTGMLLRLYREKFMGERFDVVMVSDNDAFTFARQYRDVLFPGVH